MSRKLLPQLYVYVAAFANLAAGATGNQNIIVTTDSDFLWQATTFNGNDNTAAEPFNTQVANPFLINIADGGNTRAIIQAPIPVDMFCGKGAWPAILPTPYLLAAGSQITVTLTSYAAANLWKNLYVALHGRKLWTTGGVNGPAGQQYDGVGSAYGG